jgi:ubiquinone/menaquinone biosynthesis C-methylase UbiE
VNREEARTVIQGDRARIASYARAYNDDYGFEQVMVAARQRRIVTWLFRHSPETILEVGSGRDSLVEAADAAGVPFTKWIIVEPSDEFARIASERMERDTRLGARIHVIRDFMEQSVEQVGEICPDKVDAVVCSSLLHEVSDPTAMMDVIRSVVRPGQGRLHANVPNALSLHRRLARAMGLIPDEWTKSERNIQLGQSAVLDAEALERLVRAAGFEIYGSGGIMLKPFTHAQMEALPFSTPDLLEGLDLLGSELPELAAEVYVEARAGDEARPGN